MISDKKITNNPLPLTVSIEPNNICNAKCSFCAYGKEKRVLESIRADDRAILDKRPKQHISPKILDHVFDLCEKSGAGVLRKFSISPNFGEVSVSRNWVDMIKRAKSNCGIDNVSSYTNAITLNRTGIDNLINSGLVPTSVQTLYFKGIPFYLFINKKSFSLNFLYSNIIFFQLFFLYFEILTNLFEFKLLSILNL